MLIDIKKISGHLAVLTLLVFTPGCLPLFVAGGVTGASYAVWKRGTLTQIFQQPLLDVHAATVRALEELNLPVNRNEKDGMSAKVESQFSDGKKIKINIKHKAYTATEINIRVGSLFGDEHRSFQLLGAISQEL